MNKSKYLHIFFAEPDDGNGGGIADLVDPPQQDDADLGTAPDEPKETVTPAAPLIDYDKFGAAIAAAFPKQQQQEQKPQLSKEEIARLTKDWEPDDEFLERFDNIKTKKAAVKELFDRAAARAEALSQVHTYGEVQRLQQTFAPQLQKFEVWEAQQRQARFNAKYPELANPALVPLVGQVWQQTISSKQFDGEDPAFDATAKGIERIIQSTNPQFKLKSAAKSTANPNELPTQSAGSGGGGGTSEPRTKKGPPGIHLFRNLQ